MRFVSMALHTSIVCWKSTLCYKTWQYYWKDSEVLLESKFKKERAGMILYGCQFTKTTEKNLPSHTAPFKVPHAAESRCTTHLFSLELQNPVLAHAGKYPPSPPVQTPVLLGCSMSFNQNIIWQYQITLKGWLFSQVIKHLALYYRILFSKSKHSQIRTEMFWIGVFKLEF